MLREDNTIFKLSKYFQMNKFKSKDLSLKFALRNVVIRR